MSIWSDIEDRSAGEKMRKEDMRMTIEQLTEIINKLQKENEELSEEVKVFKQRYSPGSYYHEPKYVIWPSFEEDTESIFKF